MKPLIKVCGIKELTILNELANLEKIDFLGFIFYENSPRFVSEELINRINEIDLKDKRPVCVYVDSDKDLIEETSSIFHNPILQFHGSESNDFCKSFNKEFWKVIEIKDNNSIKEITNYPDASAMLFETYKKGQHGGTGKSFDWSLIDNIKDLDTKFILSGGINIKNVDNAIEVDPWCLDINSGVESSPGKKDLNLIKEFLDKI